MIDEKLLIERIKRLENNVDGIMFKDSSQLKCTDSETMKYLFKLIINVIEQQAELQKHVYIHCNNCKYLRNNGTFRNCYYCTMMHYTVRDRDKDAKKCRYFESRV